MTAAAMAAAKRGEKLTQHLLAFARRQPLRPEVCRVDRLIAESEGLLRRALGDSYTFTLRLGTGVRNALIDSGQFEAALLNLVVNARDATPAGGEVIIESKPVTIAKKTGDLEPGKYLRVAVTDTGSGMDAATMARAVEPFFTTKPPGEGTGLGLSQVYGFARQSGGAVDIESRPGQGATVAMLLPIAEAKTAGDKAASVPTTSPASRRRMCCWSRTTPRWPNWSTPCCTTWVTPWCGPAAWPRPWIASTRTRASSWCSAT
jgi:signal transduction histidine kinase